MRDAEPNLYKKIIDGVKFYMLVWISLFRQKPPLGPHNFRPFLHIHLDKFLISHRNDML